MIFNACGYLLWTAFFELPLDAPSHWTIRGDCFPQSKYNLSDLCDDISNDFKIASNKKTFTCFITQGYHVEMFSVDPLLILLPKFFSNKEVTAIRNYTDGIEKSPAASFSHDRYGRLYKSPELKLKEGIMRKGYNANADILFEKLNQFFEVINFFCN